MTTPQADEQLVGRLRRYRDTNFSLPASPVGYEMLTQAADRIEALANAVKAEPSLPADGLLPWASVKQVPYSTVGYGGGVMLLSETGECIGYVITMNKSAHHDPKALDAAVFARLSQSPAAPVDQVGLRDGPGYWGPDVDGDWIVTVLDDAALWFAVVDEEKAQGIVAALRRLSSPPTPTDDLREALTLAVERECSSWCAPDVGEHTRACVTFRAALGERKA